MRRALRIVLWILAGFFFLFFAAVLFINTRAGKDFVRERALVFLRTKLKTEIYIGSINYELPKMVVLENVLLKDQAGDTLLSAGRMKLDIAMLKLLHSEVSIQQVYLEGVYAHIYRHRPDTVFNFDYIVKAFVSQGTDTTGIVTDTSGRLVMNIDKLVLHDVHFRMDDFTGGSRVALDVGDLNLTMRQTDPERLIFRVKKLFADSVNAVIIQDTSFLAAGPDSTVPVTLQLGADELSLRHIHYRQQNIESRFFMDIDLGSLLAHPGIIDIPNQSIAIKDFRLDHSSVNVRVAAKAAERAEKVADTIIDTNPSPQAKWRVAANTLLLNKVGFIWNDENKPRLSRGIDYSHLDIQDLSLNATEINYTTDTVEALVNHLAAKERSGLNIYELKTRLAYNPQGGYLRDLYLQTSRSIIQDYLEVRYPSVDALARNPNLMQFRLNFKNSIVGINDVLLFAPQLQQQTSFRKHQRGMIRVAANMDGRLDAMNIHKLALSGLGNTAVDMSGNLYGIPDVNKLSYNLNIRRLQSSRDDMEALLPPAALKQIRLPDRFGATGRITGTALSYQPDLLLVSTDGNAVVRGNISLQGGKGKERYDLFVKTERLNLGRILKQDTLLGAVSADLSIKGQGFDVNTMSASGKGSIHAASFKRYTYRDISFNGEISGRRAKLNLNSDDPNMHLRLKGSADFRGKYPAIVADAVIDSIDFQALHFYASQLKVRGVLHADIPELNPDYPRGTLVLDDPAIAAGGRNYFLDSVYIVSAPSADSGNNILIEGRAIHAHLWGHTPLTKTGNIIQYQISRHYALNDSSYNNRHAQRYDIPSEYDLHLVAKVEDNPVIRGFVPELRSFDTIRIEGGLSPELIYLNADAPQVSYASYNITDAKLRVNGNDSTLTYLASVDHFQQKSMDIWYANASGEVKTNTITSDISISDPDSNQKYRLSGSLQRNGGEQILQLGPGLMLNYKTWEVAQPNRIVFAKQGFYVQNFGISNGLESLTVNSKSPVYNAPLRADISNFMLSNITGIISKDTLLANGMLGGNVDLQRFNPDPMVTSVLGITNLSVMGDTIGNLDLNVRSATANAIDANAGITGRDNNIKLDGVYYPNPVNGSNFNMKLLLDPLNVASFEGVSMHQIKNTSGYLRGSLDVNGTWALPLLNGELHTDKLSTNIAMLNTQFTMPDEAIRFGGQSIIFDDFSIRDSAGNLATLNGSIVTRGFSKNMLLALHLKANNWQVMNSTPRENKDFYGRLFITTNMTAYGSVGTPSIDGSLNILKGTSVSVTIPEKQASIQEREGVVDFVDMTHPGQYAALTTVAPDTAKGPTKLPPGSELSLNVSADEGAEFSVIVDEGAGDFIRIKGKANLNATVAPDGTLGLVGNYEIQNGTYHLNYNFLRRLFTIQPGSTITFSGEPEQAELNVTAVYEANVPPYDLVERQVTDPSELVYFKQRLPFEVRMHLTGAMLQPTIGFDVVLPEEKNYRVASEVTDLVQARLNELRTNPSELNKQVFALIILNRFIGENIFESGAGGRDAEAIARQSASRFISEQLNKFAGGLIQGLDLTLDLTTSEDYTTGDRRNRTDLTLGASKRLLNDRLTVNIGSDFQLEGPQASGTQTNSVIPGNIVIDYDLAADKRYQVRIFRKNEDLGAFEGYVVSTGVSFILQKDYNRFRQVFMSRRRMERQREERKQQRIKDRQGGNSKSEPTTPPTAIIISKKEETETE